MLTVAATALLRKLARAARRRTKFLEPLATFVFLFRRAHLRHRWLWLSIGAAALRWSHLGNRSGRWMLTVAITAFRRKLARAARSRTKFLEPLATFVFLFRWTHLRHW